MDSVEKYARTEFDERLIFDWNFRLKKSSVDAASVTISTRETMQRRTGAFPLWITLTPLNFGSYPRNDVPLSPHAVREGLAALVNAGLQEVHQRIEVRGVHIRIIRQIGCRVEGDRRIAALMPAELAVMIERIEVRRLNVGVVCQITQGIEVSV